MQSDATPTGRAWYTPLLLLLAGVAAGLVLAACSGAGAASLREVLIDYNHDEFAGSFLGNFPHEVRVHPGMTVRFKQAWTGEPHSVTGGRLVDEAMSQIVPLLEEYRGTPFSEIPEEDFVRVEELANEMPYMLGEDFEDGVHQNVAQPCFRRDGGPPEDTSEPCPDEEQEQPAFDGSYDFYNSGFISYEGPGGNEFELPLADEIDTGTYYFYCSVHGPLQYSKVVVVPKEEEIPTQAEVARQARDEIEAWAQPLLESYEEATDAGSRVTMQDPMSGEKRTVDKPLAGFAAPDPWIHGFGSEFVPRDLTVKAGRSVTWSFVGPHTVSFKVPPYFSQVQVAEDGTVTFNQDAMLPVNSPEPPAHEESEDGGPPPPPPAVDAGAWDGQEFISSGVLWDGKWTITFTEPGTYKYACLIHPRMVGTVTVQQ